MKITFSKVEPNLQSVNRELVFSFQVSNLQPDVAPLNYSGELFLDNNLKVGNLFQVQNNWNIGLYARGYGKAQAHQEFEIKLYCELNDRTISFIEEYRATKKDFSKDIVFIANLNIQFAESKICLSNLYLEKEQPAKNDGPIGIYYQSVAVFNAQRTNLWVLSGDGGPQFTNYRSSNNPGITITIDLMQWVNNFVEYLGMPRQFILELVHPDKQILSEALSERYTKGVASIREMQGALYKCEWKQVVLAARPIMELFRNFDEFKNLVIANGYTEQAWLDLRKIISGMFDLLSKFIHALDRNNVNTMDLIPIHQEEAKLIFSFSLNLLSLIAEKSKRVAI